MTETFYRTGRYNADHSTFGGIISPTDYYTNYTNGNIVERIIRDWAFDNWCKNNNGKKNNIKNWRKKKND